MKPPTALFTRDPARVRPQLVPRAPGRVGAALVAGLRPDPLTTRVADVLLIASRASVAAGVRAAGTGFEITLGGTTAGRPALVEWRGLDAPEFPLGEATPENGQ